MSNNKLISYQEAANLIKDGDTVAATSLGLGGLAEQVMFGIKERYEQEEHPKDITFIHSSGIGNSQPGRGLDHLVAPGLAKRIISGHLVNSPLMNQAIIDNKIEAYLFPQGVIATLFRAIAGNKPGVITKVGLDTFVDPRIEGAKANSKTTEDLIDVIEIDGEEWLNYKKFPIDVALIRGTYADEKGNITWDRETTKFEGLSVAQAAKNSGGIVIAQVIGQVENGFIDPKQVYVPGVFVDYVVVVDDLEYHQQTSAVEYDPGLSNEIRVPVSGKKPRPLDIKKVIQRRAAMELVPNSVANLGVGIPDGVSTIADEEGVSDELTLTLELGPIGGTAASGLSFGATYNAQAFIAHPEMFDFYDGGGLDLSVLGLAQTDEKGNINVSKFGPKVVGPGGFVNISQNTPKIVFVGTFTVGGKAEIKDGKLNILEQGRAKKFIKQVEQITFSGQYATENNQEILYVTERAVFDLFEGQLRLIELAPGVDLERDVLDWMDFEPIIPDEIKEMNPDIFQENWGKLKNYIYEGQKKGE